MTNSPYFTMTFFTRKPRSEVYTDHKVYVRISVAGQNTDLAIDFSVNPENWDQKRKLSKGRSRRDLELNKYIDEIWARFCEIHTNLVREKKLVIMSCTDAKCYLIKISLWTKREWFKIFGVKQCNLALETCSE